MKSLLIGWAVIAAIVAPVIVGGIIAGDQGAMAVLLFYIGCEVVLLLTMGASVIGDIIRDR